MKVKWSEGEKAIVSAHYAKLGQRGTSALLKDRSPKSVTMLAMRMGIQVEKNKVIRAESYDATALMECLHVPLRFRPHGARRVVLGISCYDKG